MTVSPALPYQSAEQSASEFTFTRRSLLPLRSDRLWLLESGVVRTLTYLEDGTSSIQGLWGAGDVVGKVFSSAKTYQIECLTSVKVTALPKHRWHEVTEVMALHVQRMGELIEILQCRQAESALLKLLAWLAKRFGQELEQGKRIDLRLTHQDIAELIGLTRVTVTRLLSDFEKQGIIQRQERQLIVLHDQPSFWHYEI